MELSFLHHSMGAEITGLDCAQTADAALAGRLRETLSEHQVLLFRNQKLEDAEFVRFCRAFGELEILPEPEKRHPEFPEIFNLSNVRPDGSLTPRDDPQAIFLRGTSRWHTDSSFREVPCLATVLYAVEVPPEGGDTEFANMVAAHDSLTADQRTAMNQKRAVHSYAYSRAANPGKLKPLTAEELAKVPDTSHPVIRQHPDGRCSVYLGGHVSHFDGEPVEASRQQVRELEDRLTDLDNVYRHQWRKGDLLLWDNRTTLHRLTGYEIDRHARVMRRCTVTGTEKVMSASPA
jgi:alpha-ketoglutarate-dependent taurine dioxygenase